jgi:hypothetical protein
VSRTVLLDNIAHQDLRVRTGYSAEFGDKVNSALIFPTEFTYAQREYPILFRRDSGGRLQAVALLGLDRDENLFLDDTGWNARYIPATHQRGPFLIGFRNRDVEGDVVREPVIHVDLDHPRISQAEGEPVFLRHGGNSPFLEHANRMLQIIYTGTAAVGPMYAAWEESGLLEAAQIQIQLDDRTQYSLPGFLTISQDRLSALDGAQLERLHRAGYLHPAMLVLSSLGNIPWLIELKNRRRAAGLAARQ